MSVDEIKRELDLVIGRLIDVDSDNTEHWYEVGDHIAQALDEVVRPRVYTTDEGKLYARCSRCGRQSVATIDYTTGIVQIDHCCRVVNAHEAMAIRDDNEIADAFVAGRAYERSFALVGRVDLPYDAPPFDTERVQRVLDLPDPVTGETERDLLRHRIKRRDNRIAFLHDRLQALGQRLVRIRKIAAGVDT